MTDNARVTQEVVHPIVLGDTQLARVSQVVVHVIYKAKTAGVGMGRNRVATFID